MKTLTLTTSNAKSTILIARALVGAAKGRQLHRAIRRALTNVTRALVHLESRTARSAERDRDGKGERADIAGTMIEVRRRFASLAEVLRGYAAMPEGEPTGMGESARFALAEVLPQGTSFLSGSVETLVVDGEQALERARDEDVARALAAVHCEPLVELCRASVSALAEAHDTVLRTDAERARDALPGYSASKAVLDAIREYTRVVEACALVDETTPAGELLLPVRNANAKARRNNKPASEPAEEADEPPPSVAA